MLHEADLMRQFQLVAPRVVEFEIIQRRKPPNEKLQIRAKRGFVKEFLYQRLNNALQVVPMVVDLMPIGIYEIYLANVQNA